MYSYNKWLWWKSTLSSSARALNSTLTAWQYWSSVYVQSGIEKRELTWYCFLDMARSLSARSSAFHLLIISTSLDNGILYFSWAILNPCWYFNCLNQNALNFDVCLVLLRVRTRKIREWLRGNIGVKLIHLELCLCQEGNKTNTLANFDCSQHVAMKMKDRVQIGLDNKVDI